MFFNFLENENKREVTIFVAIFDLFSYPALLSLLLFSLLGGDFCVVGIMLRHGCATGVLRDGDGDSTALVGTAHHRGAHSD